MKKIFILFIGIMTASTMYAQKLEDIVKNHLEAIGGEKTIANLKTIQFDAKLEAQGMQFDSKMTLAYPDKMYNEMSMMGETIKQWYNGEKGWATNPMSGSTEPQPIPEEQLKDLKEEDMQGFLYNYKEKGTKLELMGSRDVEGVDCHQIKVIRKSGYEASLFIDKETYLIMMVESVAKEGPMAGAAVEKHFSDFETIDGHVMALSTTIKANGQKQMSITMSNVKINEKIDMSIFDAPVAK